MASRYVSWIPMLMLMLHFVKPSKENRSKAENSSSLIYKDLFLQNAIEADSTKHGKFIIPSWLWSFFLPNRSLSKGKISKSWPRVFPISPQSLWKAWQPQVGCQEATGVHTFAAEVVGRATGSLREGVEAAKVINRCFWMSLFTPLEELWYFIEIRRFGRTSMLNYPSLKWLITRLIRIIHWGWCFVNPQLDKLRHLHPSAPFPYTNHFMFFTISTVQKPNPCATRNLGEASLPFIPCTITACMLILMPLKSLDTGDGQLIEFQDPRSQQKVIHGQNDFGTKMRANIHTRNQ